MSSPVYVKYTVQNADTLSALLNASTMTLEEWVRVNVRDRFQSLNPGEKIILKDPGASCSMEDVIDPNMGCPFSQDTCRSRCEDLYNLFKPLQAYTEHL